ncbi:hypothetical protein KGR20_18270 [Cytobacillus oceanisediminis]|uniref:thiazole synthase n=1 Tax=Niallia alba TaxID=2729105 RepID=A0A7Y0K7G3_9BACI|nr:MULTISPECIES: hypothetical protein [Bacillaceae]MBQ6446118.1 hypothetical protein [Bacillus sp. (in: firmicutes)]MBZ9536124.1 hypothetical protein [Cytobacillus oceanisediminis]NMO76987.1 hypothetical protein [Niallia alba]UTI40193.1 hypothetical protein NKG37_14735 [Niallia sp. RD1]
MKDTLVIGGEEFTSRLFVGTGKFANHQQMEEVLEKSNTEVVTVALRRVDIEAKEENILNNIPANMRLMPNTSGARTADEAVRIARLAKAIGMGNWVKIEVISDHKYLLPDIL